MKRIIKIVLTGGVCSGKTTALPILADYLNDRYACLTVPETATVLVNNGFDPRKNGDMYNFQKAILSHQLKTESEYEMMAEKCEADTVIILLDRGAVDAFAYLDKGNAEKLMSDTGLNKEQLLNRYHAVIHLVTAADGARSYYTNENNSARTETPEEAIVLDRKTFDAWHEHPMHFVADNSGDFSFKLAQVKKHIDEIIKKELSQR